MLVESIARPESASQQVPPVENSSHSNDPRPGLARRVLDLWIGYGVPGAIASGDRIILPFRRPAGAGPLTIALTSNGGAYVADVLDDAVVAAFAEIYRVDDVERILDEYPDLTFQPEGDEAPTAFYSFTLLGFNTLARRVYDLYQASLQAVWYADGWNRPDVWGRASRQGGL